MGNLSGPHHQAKPPQHPATQSSPHKHPHSPTHRKEHHEEATQPSALIQKEHHAQRPEALPTLPATTIWRVTQSPQQPRWLTVHSTSEIPLRPKDETLFNVMLGPRGLAPVSADHDRLEKILLRCCNSRNKRIRSKQRLLWFEILARPLPPRQGLPGSARHSEHATSRTA